MYGDMGQQSDNGKFNMAVGRHLEFKTDNTCISESWIDTYSWIFLCWLCSIVENRQCVKSKKLSEINSRWRRPQFWISFWGINLASNASVQICHYFVLEDSLQRCNDVLRAAYCLGLNWKLGLRSKLFWVLPNLISQLFMNFTKIILIRCQIII